MASQFEELCATRSKQRVRHTSESSDLGYSSDSTSSTAEWSTTTFPAAKLHCHESILFTDDLFSTVTQEVPSEDNGFLLQTVLLFSEDACSCAGIADLFECSPAVDSKKYENIVPSDAQCNISKNYKEHETLCSTSNIKVTTNPDIVIRTISTATSTICYENCELGLDSKAVPETQDCALLIADSITDKSTGCVQPQECGTFSGQEDYKAIFLSTTTLPCICNNFYKELSCDIEFDKKLKLQSSAQLSTIKVQTENELSLPTSFQEDTSKHTPVLLLPSEKEQIVSFAQQMSLVPEQVDSQTNSESLLDCFQQESSSNHSLLYILKLEEVLQTEQSPSLSSQQDVGVQHTKSLSYPSQQQEGLECTESLSHSLQQAVGLEHTESLCHSLQQDGGLERTESLFHSSHQDGGLEHTEFLCHSLQQDRGLECPESLFHFSHQNGGLECTGSLSYSSQQERSLQHTEPLSRSSNQQEENAGNASALQMSPEPSRRPEAQPPIYNDIEETFFDQFGNILSENTFFYNNMHDIDSSQEVPVWEDDDEFYSSSEESSDALVPGERTSSCADAESEYSVPRWSREE